MEYGFPPESRIYREEEIPLYQRTWSQIWHQGTIYPATCVAVPVWCAVIHRFPAVFHGELFVLLALIEASRQRRNTHPPGLEAHLSLAFRVNYRQALEGLAAVLPAQMALADPTTPHSQDALRVMRSLLNKW
ncbi:hypothetical protein GO986_19645 [Deinococcus sp. HMF7620]|uniref:Uncharacterized protein n=1 Tax=Deinococcus arboris TaxID=2682977 RepID=A0A7C9MBC5_9DEIO|nr:MULTISPECIES: hypothetical protein [Deinococcus]MBZ9753119.1 hypothetical protein [Deinococcus betulae]MVN88959.1 hypothetical protein [Deinococcus arboris]